MKIFAKGTRRLSALGAPLAVGLFGLLAPSCQPAFTTEVSGRSLSIQITDTNDTGSATNRLPITFSTPNVFTVHITATDETGALDSTFTGYVRLSIQPGTVVSVTGTNTNGRNVKLVNGVLAQDVQVAVVGATGNSRILVEDLGYQPKNPLATPPPECANGIDDNHNGLVDYGVDPGCYAPDDDTEDGGSYASASSQIIYYAYPSIADINGVASPGAGTPFPNEQVQINTEWNGPTSDTGLVVTGVASTGFFVTDISKTQYASVFGYTYSAPTLMNVCDRLITFGGTTAEFYGFLEVNYPTWSLEEWDPQARPCLVPEPITISTASLQDTSTETATLLPLISSLVRVPVADGSTINIGRKLGPTLMPYTMVNGAPVFASPVPGTDATNCDYEGTGKIDFTNPIEAGCENACSLDYDCSEYTSYVSESQFSIVITSADGSQHGRMIGDGAAAPGFDPIQHLGERLLAFTGNLTYFSGGSQFTIQARCADDVVFPGSPILPSSPPWPVPDGGVMAPAACVTLTPALQP
jgi:hypothetical protein